MLLSLLSDDATPHSKRHSTARRQPARVLPVPSIYYSRSTGPCIVKMLCVRFKSAPNIQKAT